MKETSTHVYFYTNVFSNWYSTKKIVAQFNYDGFLWNNTEEAFMYLKALCFNDLETAEAIKEHARGSKHPSGVKDLGRMVKGYDDRVWAEKRFDAMFLVNLCKFSQNPQFSDILLKTGDKVLVEASPVDLIWGVGLGENDPLILEEKNWRGQNLLGKALMKVRRSLKNYENCH